MSDKLEHLKMIQDVIARVSNTSALLKGWTVTLFAVFFAFAAKDADKEAARMLVIVSFLPLLVSALMDVHYVWQERLFRILYDKVRDRQTVDFSMDTTECQKEFPSWKAAFSIAIWPFYSAMLAVLTAVALYLFRR